MKRRLLVFGVVFCMVLQLIAPASVAAATDYSGQTFLIPVENEDYEEGYLGTSRVENFYDFDFTKGKKTYTVEKSGSGYIISGSHGGTKIYFCVKDTTNESNRPIGYDSERGEYYVGFNRYESNATVWEFEEKSGILESGVCLKTTKDGKTYYVKLVGYTYVSVYSSYYSHAWRLRLTETKGAASVFDLHAHNELTHVEAKAATCTEDGNIEHYICSCGSRFLDNAAKTPTTSTNVKISMLGHLWNEKIEDDSHLRATASTCDENNTYWYDCSRDKCTAISGSMYFTSPTKTGPHSYDNVCDAECNNCGATREVGDHAYDNDCDAECNNCGATREVGDHAYDNACDVDCNNCGATREVGDHAYDNACDKDCNSCGATREVSDHAYDNACDKDCNSCGATREVGDHTYDNACDADCNNCGAIREVGDHAYDNACDKECNNCGATREVSDHAYDNACDADCNNCGAIREVGDHAYDNEQDADCNNCGAIREIESGEGIEDPSAPSDDPSVPSDEETKPEVDKDAPQTGDDFNFMMLFVLLLISGGTMIALTVNDRKRKA